MEFLIYLSMILLMGVLASTLAQQLKVSNIFFLVLTGMVLGAFDMIHFDDSVLTTIATLTLILVVFECSDAIRFKEFKKFIKPAARLAIIYFILNLVILAFATFFSFNAVPILVAVMFSALMSGIDPVVAISTLGNKKNRLIEILELESVINTPITVIVPLFMIKMITTTTGSNILITLKNYGLVFFQQISIALVIGLIIGYMLVSIMKKSYLGNLSHLAVITSATIAYVSSELLSGSGVLAVTAFGLIFGNLHPDHKVELQKFSAIFSNTLLILVFILLGMKINIEPQYILIGSLLFLVHLGVRFVSTYISLPHIGIKKIVFSTLNVPKGIDVAVVILLVSTTYSYIPGVEIIINLGLLFTLFSITLATVNSSILQDWVNDESKSDKK